MSSSSDEEDLFELHPDLIDDSADGEGSRDLKRRSLSRNDTPAGGDCGKEISKIPSGNGAPTDEEVPRQKVRSLSRSTTPTDIDRGTTSLSGFHLRERLRARFRKTRTAKTSEPVTSTKERPHNVDKLSRFINKVFTREDSPPSKNLNEIEMSILKQDDGFVAGPIARLPDDILLECLARMDRAAIGPAARVCRSWRSLIHCSSYSEYREALGLMESHVMVISQSPRASSEVRQLMCRMTTKF